MSSLRNDGIEIQQVQSERVDAFWKQHDRNWRSEYYTFRVVWHEQQHEIVALDNETVVAALHLRIVASLAYIEALYVLPEYRRRGLAADLLTRAEIVANYHNCHKMTAEAVSGSTAHTVLVACGYNVEATLLQHTFKLDIALLRKFLL